MALNSIDRGVLEQHIDNAINNMKIILEMIRDERIKPWLRDKDGVDMAIGFCYGEILALFLSGYLVRNAHDPTDDEKTEIKKILDKRLGEIREAVYNCG